MITCTRYHDISCGHRVVDGGKCQALHGHNYRIHFTCEAERLDSKGMVVDFAFMKEIFCEWLEDNWDHRMLIFIDDPYANEIHRLGLGDCAVPFNPTAENMAYFLYTLQWELPAGVNLISVRVEETRKCSAEASR